MAKRQANLAFSIANELLNRGFIKPSVSATFLESVIADLLPIEYPVVHYKVRQRAACNQAARQTLQMTRERGDVTCKRCLQMLEKGSRLITELEEGEKC